MYICADPQCANGRQCPTPQEEFMCGNDVHCPGVVNGVYDTAMLAAPSPPNMACICMPTKIFRG